MAIIDKDAILNYQGDASRFRNPRVYVEWYIQEYKIIITANGNVTNEKKHHKEQIFNTLWLDYSEHLLLHNLHNKDNKSQQVKPIKETDMRKGLDELVTLMRTHMSELKRDEIRCDVEDLTELRRFVLAVTGTLNENYIAVLAHFVWSVKRKLNGLSVDYHIMPVIYGGQMAGKTKAVRQLVKPVSDFQLNMQLTELVDSRYFFSMAENYVVVFDEMQKADKADLEGLKNQITAEVNNPRRLHTHETMTIPQNCSFIGTTNRPLSDQIKDVTGMRRFYQIDSLEKIDWDTVNCLDYMSIWRGVDEKKKFGYTIDRLEEIGRMQKSWTSETPYEAFCDEYNIRLHVKGNNVERDNINGPALFAELKDWGDKTGHNVGSKTSFTQFLKGAGIPTTTGQSRGYAIPVGHYLKDKMRENVLRLERKELK